MSILKRIREFNLICWLLGCDGLCLRPINSLREYKATGRVVRVGDVCKCKRCAKEFISYSK